ncbi:MAG: sigma-70 family RNA polymerase sigma factor [Balneolaceae bacterium]|nr:sigma-70 family RNA polymerase sigma factor [Balneolaceae bacterium]
MESDNEKMQEFVSLFSFHHGKISSYILTLVPNYSDAADIMQETSKTMWAKFSDFTIGTDFLAWGLTIAHYRVLEYRKKKKRSKEVQFSEDLFEKLGQAVEKRQDKSTEYLSSLKKCFKFLKEEDQRLILLRYYEHLKIKEIAGRLGKTVQTVYRNISRIQESLLCCINKVSFGEGNHRD